MSKITVTNLQVGLDTFTKSEKRRTVAESQFTQAVETGASPAKAARRALKEATLGMKNAEAKYEVAIKAAGVLPKPKMQPDDLVIPVANSTDATIAKDQTIELGRPQDVPTFWNGRNKARLLFGIVGLAIAIVIVLFTWSPWVFAQWAPHGFANFGIGLVLSLLYSVLVLLAFPTFGMWGADFISTKKLPSNQQPADIDATQSTTA